MSGLTFELWLRAQGYAPTTVKEYVTAQSFILRECPRLSEDEIQLFYGSREENSTRIFYFYALRTLGQFLKKDLTKGIAYKRAKRTRGYKFLNDHDLQKLLELKPLDFERKYKALFLLIVATGLRVSEALSIGAEDFSTVMTVRCKGDSDRQVYVDPIAHAEILRLLYNKQRGSLFDFNRNTAYVGMRKMADRAGVAGMFPHRGRHTFAVSVLNSNLTDIDWLRDALGHSSLTSTQVYAHTDPAKKMETYLRANPIGRLMTPEPSRPLITSPGYEISALRGRRALLEPPVKRRA